MTRLVRQTAATTVGASSASPPAGRTATTTLLRSGCYSNRKQQFINHISNRQKSYGIFDIEKKLCKLTPGRALGIVGAGAGSALGCMMVSNKYEGRSRYNYDHLETEDKAL